MWRRMETMTRSSWAAYHTSPVLSTQTDVQQTGSMGWRFSLGSGSGMGEMGELSAPTEQTTLLDSVSDAVLIKFCTTMVLRDAWASKFFRFHAVFGIWRVHAPPGGYAPPSGKSWIRHCYGWVLCPFWSFPVIHKIGTVLILHCLNLKKKKVRCS